MTGRVISVVLPAQLAGQPLTDWNWRYIAHEAYKASISEDGTGHVGSAEAAVLALIADAVDRSS